VTDGYERVKEPGKGLRANTTPSPGLVVWERPGYRDNCGWFTENW
jgi:hypothetical protein